MNKEKDVLVNVGDSVIWNQKDNTFKLKIDKNWKDLKEVIKEIFEDKEPEEVFAELLVNLNLPENIELLFIAKFNEFKKEKNLFLMKVKEKKNKLLRLYQ